MKNCYIGVVILQQKSKILSTKHLYFTHQFSLLHLTDFNLSIYLQNTAKNYIM
jgi:hypothetical protein